MNAWILLPVLLPAIPESACCAVPSKATCAAAEKTYGMIWMSRSGENCTALSEQF